MFKKILLLLIFVASPSLAQDEIYMANQAGGYLALTHEGCKVEKLKDRFPYHAYGIDKSNQIVGIACYQIPPVPTREELSEVPAGMQIIPVVNLIDLKDGEIYTLETNLFSSTKPGNF